ncbi:hypothetical protein C0Q70_00932 [Pomacea canaliculata]|uniref:Uncharacterized protein n=1 Tax=Pomacea canaliculata TaxID=400727 RepID=A0A2T7PY42_POMCA|nr:hypothetical protein C0Q70_00932 [Pomacea canaliculata]
MDKGMGKPALKAELAIILVDVKEERERVWKPVQPLIGSLCRVVHDSIGRNKGEGRGGIHDFTVRHTLRKADRMGGYCQVPRLGDGVPQPQSSVQRREDEAEKEWKGQEQTEDMLK